MLRVVVERNGEIVHNKSVDGRFVSIGRSDENDIVLDHTSVSARHFVVKIDEDGSATAIDHSSNGTFQAGEQISALRFRKPVELTVSDFRITLIPVNRSGETKIDDLDRRTTHQQTPHPETNQPGPPDLGTIEVMSSGGETEITTVADDSAPTLTIGLTDGSEKVIPLTRSVLIGRSGDADIVLDSLDVSRRHCSIFQRGHGSFIRLISRVNPILVGDRILRTNEVVELKDGDVIDICGYRMKYTAGSVPASVPEGSAQIGLNTRRRVDDNERLQALEIIGFLGGKNIVRFHRDVDPALFEVDRLILDLGYLVGIDGPGIDALEQTIRTASLRGVTISLDNVPTRIRDVIASSIHGRVILPHAGENG